MSGCLLRLANFSQSLWNDCSWRDCDLSGAMWMECRLNQWTAGGCDLTGASFFRTSLKGVDLSTCGIDAITVSETFSELKGLTVGAHQTVGLARLLGIKVEN